MREIFIGEYIRHHRQDQGLSQEKLCEGICEPMTLSRLENGKQTPSRNRIQALLQRLGLPDDRYFALLTPYEAAIEPLQKEISDCLVQHRREAGLEKLGELEALAEEDDQLTRQFILFVRALLGRADGEPYSPSEQMDLLTESIRLTMPRFSPETMGGQLYSHMEVRIMNQIADLFSQCGEHKRAFDLFEQLMEYIQNRTQGILWSRGVLGLVSLSYARALARTARHREALEIAELGWSTCIRMGYYDFSPALLHVMAECYHFLGSDEKSRDLYSQAYYLYEALGDQYHLLRVAKSAREQLCLEF